MYKYLLSVMLFSSSLLSISAQALDADETRSSIQLMNTLQNFGTPPGQGCASTQFALTPAGQAMAQTAASPSFFEQVCGPLGAEKDTLLGIVPAAFSSIDQTMLRTQDENPGTYLNHALFSAQLTGFVTKGDKSRRQACQWLFWNNGTMRRPYSGTLCAIGKKSAFIQAMAAKHHIPPEFLACTIGGDSMMYTHELDVIAKRKHGPNPLPAEQYVFHLVKPQAFDNSHPNYTFASTDETEQLIERMAVIGAEAKAKYMSVYGRTNLEFGGGPEHEAAILATVYNIGLSQVNPNPQTNPSPGLNYFGLSCARMMSAYKKHLNPRNPSSAACL